jgi:nucleoid-associated protein YgaU
MSEHSRIVMALRFVVGVSMVAGGAAMATPFLLALAAASSRQGSPDVATTAPAVVAAAPAVWATPPQGFADASRSSAATVSIPDGHQAAMQPLPALAAAAASPAFDDYTPPQPPGALPRVPAELMAAGPEFTGTYRSTFDLPPPPLLDGHQPPPVQIGWSPRSEGRSVPDVQSVPAALVPPSYVIRDGDDLTSIATRFYGHPAAAGAVWSANRGTLSDPDVLPIGAELRLPPPWTIAVGRAGSSGAIDPRPMAAAAPRTQAPPLQDSAVRPVSWLGEAPPAAPPDLPNAPSLPHVTGAVSPPPVGGAAARPGSVRLAPGETLESLATRLYGDPAMARRIWEANRDRLRSPALAIPGMELRLP